MRRAFTLVLSAGFAFSPSCNLPGPRTAPEPGGDTPAVTFGIFLGHVTRRGQAHLWWSSVEGAERYTVLRRTTTAGEFMTIATTGSAVVFYGEQLPNCEEQVCAYIVEARLSGDRPGPRTKQVNLRPVDPGAKTKERFVLGLIRDSRWSTTHWDGESSPKEVLLDLHYSASGVRAVLRVGHEAPEVFANAVEKEPRLIEGPNFRMEFFADNPRVAGIEVTRGDGSERTFLLTRVL